MTKHNKLIYICLTGVFTAVVFLLTAYLHIPSHTGYTHVGDGVIYLAACLLPLPYALVAGCGGALLADCLTGYAIWAPASIVIKAFSVLCFSRRSARILTTRNIIALIPAAILCTGGYYLYEVVLTGNYVAPLAGVPGYVTQSVLSMTLFIFLGLALDKINIKKRI